MKVNIKLEKTTTDHQHPKGWHALMSHWTHWTWRISGIGQFRRRIVSATKRQLLRRLFAVLAGNKSQNTDIHIQKWLILERFRIAPFLNKQPLKFIKMLPFYCLHHPSKNWKFRDVGTVGICPPKNFGNYQRWIPLSMKALRFGLHWGIPELVVFFSYGHVSLQKWPQQNFQV